MVGASPTHPPFPALVGLHHVLPDTHTYYHVLPASRRHTHVLPQAHLTLQRRASAFSTSFSVTLLLHWVDRFDYPTSKPRNQKARRPKHGGTSVAHGGVDAGQPLRY